MVVENIFHNDAIGTNSGIFAHMDVPNGFCSASSKYKNLTQNRGETETILFFNRLNIP